MIFDVWERRKFVFGVLTEPPVTRFSSRRKSVFAETYNPEEDEDDDEGAKVVLACKLAFCCYHNTSCVLDSLDNVYQSKMAE
jgi:hypothetical protein